MKAPGERKTPTKVAGHQECGICHPDTTKGGRARERRWGREESRQGVEDHAARRTDGEG